MWNYQNNSNQNDINQLSDWGSYDDPEFWQKNFGVPEEFTSYLSQPESMKSGSGDNGVGSEFGVKIGDAVETSDVVNSSGRAAGDANFGVESSGSVMNTAGSRVAVNNGSEYQAVDNANAGTVAGAGGSGVGYKAAEGGQKSDYESRVRDGVFSNKDFGIGEDEKKSVFTGAVKEQRNDKEVQKSLGEYKRELAKSGLSREEKEVRYRGTEEYYLSRRVEKKVKLLKSKKELINKLQSEIDRIEDTTEREDYLAGLDMTEYVRKNLKSGEFTDAELGEVVRGVREVVEGEVKDKYSYDEKKRAAALAGRDGYQVRADEFRAETDLSTADKKSIAERNPGEWEENSELAEELYTKATGGRFNEILADEGLSEEEKHARMRALNEGAYQEAYKVAGWYTELVKSLEERYPDTRSIAGLSNQELREYMAESLEKNNIRLSRQEAEMLREKLLLHVDERFPMSAAGRQREEAGKPSDLAEEQEERDKIFAENPAVVKLREDVVANFEDKFSNYKYILQGDDKRINGLVEKWISGYWKNEYEHKVVHEALYNFIMTNYVDKIQNSDRQRLGERKFSDKIFYKDFETKLVNSHIKITDAEGLMIEEYQVENDIVAFDENSPLVQTIVNNHFKKFIAGFEGYENLSDDEQMLIKKQFVELSGIVKRVRRWRNSEYIIPLEREVQNTSFEIEETVKDNLIKSFPDKFNKQMDIEEIKGTKEYSLEINKIENVKTELNEEKFEELMNKYKVPAALRVKYKDFIRQRTEAMKNKLIIQKIIEVERRIDQKNERIMQEYPDDWQKRLIHSPYGRQAVREIGGLYYIGGLYSYNDGDTEGGIRIAIAQEIVARQNRDNMVKNGDIDKYLASERNSLMNLVADVTTVGRARAAKKSLELLMMGCDYYDIKEVMQKELEVGFAVNLMLGFIVSDVKLFSSIPEWIPNDKNLIWDTVGLVNDLVVPLTHKSMAEKAVSSAVTNAGVIMDEENELGDNKLEESIYSQNGAGD